MLSSSHKQAGLAHVWPLVGLLCLALVLPAFRTSGQEADAATKKLLAANGLFQRQLYKLAAEQYEQFVKDYPQHAEAATARYALGICWFRMGQPEKAAFELKEVLAVPGFKHGEEAMLVLGHCHLGLKDYPSAIAAFDQLIAKYPKGDQVEAAMLSRAQALYLAGRKTDAVAACDGFLRAYPTSRYQAEATMLYGQSLESAGKLDEAAAQYQKLTAAASSKQAEAYLALGTVQYRKGDYPAAIRTLAKVAAVPQSAVGAAARMQLGLAQLAGRQIGDARKTLGEVVRTDPARAAAAKYWLAQCDIAERRYDAALKLLDELARIEPALPNSDRVAMDRGQCLLALAKYDEAAKQFEAFLKQYPKSDQAGEATYREAFCLHKLGQYDRSLALCRSRSLAAEHPLARSLGELTAENLFFLSQYGPASAAYEQLSQGTITVEQRQRYALRMGQCAYFAKDYAKAVDLLKPLNSAVGDEELKQGMLLLGDALLQVGKNDEAAQVLARYVAWDRKDKLEAQFKLALAQLRANKADAAEKTLSEVMAGGDSPWALRATFEYGQLKYRQKDPARAAEALKKVASSSTAELAAPAAYLLAWIDFDAKHYAQSAEGFARVASRYPKDPRAADAVFYQGAALKEAGSEDKAMKVFEAYVNAYPKGEYALKSRQMIAACLVKLERNAEAVKALSALAADRATTSDEVLYDLAWSQQAMKDSAAAESTYRRLLAEYPGSRLAASARSELAEILFNQQKYADAARLLARVITDPSADARTISVALYRLGSCYEKLGDSAQAAAMYTTFLERHGSDELASWAHYQAAVNLLKQNKLPEAQEHLRKVLASSPKPELAAAAMVKLGESQAQGDDYDASRKTYMDFLEKFPQDRLTAQAQFGIGWAMENQKRYDDARQWYGKVTAASNTPTAARAQFQIGETWFAQGQFEQAAAALLAVADVYAYPEWSARALFEAGRAFEQLKQPEQAKKQYQAVMSRYKEQPEAAMAEKRLKAM